MSRALDDLDPRFRPLAIELVARAIETKIPVLIVDTLRTEAEQAINIANGVSWTMHSKHLPQPPHGLSLAIDLVPYDLFTLEPGGDKLQWDNAHPAWQKLGAIGERLGLRWGGRWKQKDMGHFEYVGPKKGRKSGSIRARS
jgi:hypothetical protein